MRHRTWLLALVTIGVAAFLVLAVGCEEEAPGIEKYPDAEDVKTGSRGTFPIALLGEEPLEPHKFKGNMRYRAFETSDSADSVLDFYRGHRDDRDSLAGEAKSNVAPQTAPGG